MGIIDSGVHVTISSQLMGNGENEIGAQQLVHRISTFAPLTRIQCMQKKLANRWNASNVHGIDDDILPTLDLWRRVSNH